MKFAVGLVLALVLAGCVRAPGPHEPGPSRDPLPWHNFIQAAGNGSDATAEPHNFVVTTGTGPANELSIAVNPKDPLSLVAGGKDYHLFETHKADCPASGDGPRYPRNVWSGVYWSRDGGRTWQNQMMKGHPRDAANATDPNRAWPCNSDPVVAFDASGRAYYSGLGIRGPATPDPAHPCTHRNRSIWLMTSADQGATWDGFSCVSSSVAAAGGLVGEVVDKQWFAVDGEFVYFVYMKFNPTDLDLVFRRSTDGGRTWQPELVLHELTAATPDVSGRQFAMPVVGPAGEVYVAWLNFGSDDGIFLAKSTDHGEHFGAPTKVHPVNAYPAAQGRSRFAPNLYRIGNLPVLAVDAGAGAHRGNLYLTWPDWNGADADVKFARSTDGGATWSTPIVLEGANGTAEHQFLPWIATSPRGDVHVVWLDNAASKDPELLDVVLRSSVDGGTTWLPGLRVNAETVETKSCYHQGVENFIGDYVGLAASDEAVHPLWPDGRTGRCEAITATIVR